MQSLQQFKFAPVKAYLHNTNPKDKFQLHTGNSSAEQMEDFGLKAHYEKPGNKTSW